MAVKPNYQGFVEPKQWPRDDGTRREPVLDADHSPPRVVRYVGWRNCIRCGELFWSEDTTRMRMCPGSAITPGCRTRGDRV